MASAQTVEANSDSEVVDVNDIPAFSSNSTNPVPGYSTPVTVTSNVKVHSDTTKNFIIDLSCPISLECKDSLQSIKCLRRIYQDSVSNSKRELSLVTLRTNEILNRQKRIAPLTFYIEDSIKAYKAIRLAESKIWDFESKLNDLDKIENYYECLYNSALLICEGTKIDSESLTNFLNMVKDRQNLYLKDVIEKVNIVHPKTQN